jgi:hypothetical protein
VGERIIAENLVEFKKKVWAKARHDY